MSDALSDSFAFIAEMKASYAAALPTVPRSEAATSALPDPPRASHLRDMLHEHCEDPAPVVTADYIDASLTVEELDRNHDSYQPLPLTSKPHYRIDDAMHAQVQAALALHTAGRLPPRHSR